MANGIKFGTSEMDNLKFGAVQVDEVYLGAVLVWPISTSGSIITIGDDEDGSAAGNYSGSYVVAQLSTDGSGTGAEFAITISYNLGKNKSFMSTEAIETGEEGSGYAAGEIVTLDMSTVGGTWSPTPRIEVLTVTT